MEAFVVIAPRESHMTVKNFPNISKSQSRQHLVYERIGWEAGRQPARAASTYYTSKGRFAVDREFVYIENSSLGAKLAKFDRQLSPNLAHLGATWAILATT